jgi:hypothetical protein
VESRDKKSLAHITKIKRIAIPRKHLAAEAGVVSGFKTGVGGEESFGFAAGFFEDLAIAAEVGDTQRRQAMLLGAEEVAGAAEVEIHFGEGEAVGCGGEGV